MNKNILEQYDDGLSISQIASNNNTTNYLVRKILVKNNRIIRTNSFNSRKYSLNEDVFEKIDTEEKAYWLGFMYADGCVHKSSNYVSLSLSVVDISHLEKFKHFLSFDGPIHTYSKKVGADYSRITLSSKKIKDDLVKHGCVELKTTILTFPEIDESLKYHFIRGYFDGDGSITYVKTQQQYKFRLCGTDEFLSSVKNILNIQNPLKQRFPGRGVNNYDIDVGGNIKVYKMLGLLYQNSSIHLDRKFDRFCQLRSRHIEKYGIDNSVNSGDILI